MSNDDHFINLALEMAEGVEPVASAKVASILVNRNKIIALGYCNNKSHPFAKRFGKNSDAIYFHAEVYAIYNALKKYSEEDLKNMKTTLYVARVKYPPSTNQNLITGLAKPCKGCMRAIKYFNVDRIVYTLNCTEENEVKYAVERMNY